MARRVCAGNRILSVDGHAVDTRAGARLGILSALRSGVAVRVTLEHAGQTRQVVLDAGGSGPAVTGLSEVGFHLQGELLAAGDVHGLLGAMGRALALTWQLSLLEAGTIWRALTMRSSLVASANFTWVSAMSGGGSHSVLAFLAELSITRALVNLLPVLMLGGGRILYELGERVRRDFPKDIRIRRDRSDSG